MAAFIISLVWFIGMSIGIDIGILIDIVLLPGITMFSFAAKATPKESVKRMDASIIPINMQLFIFLPLIYLYELISQMTFGQGFWSRLEKITFTAKK
jgi:hypothetical protein